MVSTPRAGVLFVFWTPFTLKLNERFIMKKLLKIGLGGFALLIVLGVLLSGGSESTTNSSSNNEASSSSEQASEPAEAPVEAVTVDIDALIGEFDNNQLAAERKYEETRITTTGELSNISEDLFGGTFITLQGTDNLNFTSVQCTSFEDEEVLTTLSNGAQTTVTGDFKEQIGNIILENCVL